MAFPLAIIGGGFAVAAIGIVWAFVYWRRSGMTRLALAHIDFVSFVAGAGGLLSLIPDSIRMFAPQLMGANPALWTALENCRAPAFLLVSLSVGLGLARRWMTIAIEARVLA